MPVHTTKDLRGSGYPTFGLEGPAATGATAKRGGLGFDSSDHPQLLDDDGTVVLTVGTNSVTSNAAFTAAGTFASTGAATFSNAVAVSGILTRSAATVTAAGTVIANATALTADVNWVNGADDAKGVQLPTGTAGRMVAIYSNHATAGLKVYPPTNGTINGGSANAAVTMEGNTTTLFLAMANADYRTIAFTANT